MIDPAAAAEALAPGFATIAPDATSEARLADARLRYALVDSRDPAAFADWLRAEDRGFLGPTGDEKKYEQSRAGIGYRRTTGVYDDLLTVDPAVPVATVDSWPAELTIPGSTVEHPRTIGSWAISAVTVAPTHRRRGIARNLLEGELRTAHALGLPMAMLTVSESTIYGRFGFSPAAFATDWTIDTRRARWIGPAASGRVEFIGIDLYRQEVAELHDRVRHTNVGDIDVWPLRWDQLVGGNAPDAERTKQLRAVRHTDTSGVTRGLALYRVTGGEPDFAQHTVEVERFDAETPDAASTLWRFLLELDLVTELKAHLRPLDETLRWQVADFRAAEVKTWEHQYLRVLDVPAAFSARTYAAPGELVVNVSDALGFTEGIWRISVVEPVETTPVPLVEPVETTPVPLVEPVET
ncbi:MAG: GNAT family N-acetyltransferase, partial [Actinomycetota bacterium]|nr:GNAT family N-acetyltransferase [Actinomycetota bacterium]